MAYEVSNFWCFRYVVCSVHSGLHQRENCFSNCTEIWFETNQQRCIVYFKTFIDFLKKHTKNAKLLVDQLCYILGNDFTNLKFIMLHFQ